MKVEIEKEKLAKLVENFFDVCGFCDELDIYEMEDLDESMQEMKDWVEENFGLNLENLKQ